MSVSFLDLSLVFAIYFYVILLIVISSILVKRKSVGTTFTRRSIHLLAGDAFLLLPLFTSPWYPATIPIGLALITVYSFKFRKESTITRSMVEKEDASLHAYGPVYYILSILILLFWLWEHKDVAMSAVMVMAWGDGAASLVPKKLAKVHKYPFSDKSLEGTLTMFAFGFLGSVVAFTIATYLGVRVFTVSQILVLTVFASAAGAITEAMTLGPLRSFDNFTVPLLTALALLCMPA